VLGAEPRLVPGQRPALQRQGLGMLALSSASVGLRPRNRRYD